MICSGVNCSAKIDAASRSVALLLASSLGWAKRPAVRTASSSLSVVRSSEIVAGVSGLLAAADDGVCSGGVVVTLAVSVLAAGSGSCDAASCTAVARAPTRLGGTPGRVNRPLPARFSRAVLACKSSSPRSAIDVLFYVLSDTAQSCGDPLECLGWVSCHGGAPAASSDC